MSVQAIHTNHDQIAALAHKFWEDEGHPEGRAEIHWLRAIESLAGPAAAIKAPAKAKTAPKKTVKAKA